MGVARIRRGLACVVAWALCVSAISCVSGSATLQSAWPVASTEPTIAPPADAVRYPLTGRTAGSERAVSRRPLCVKVADTGAVSALVGVQAADVVYETADNGNHTQLACLFQSDVPKYVAPLGAAGMPDLWIVPQYGAAFFSTGAPASLSLSMRRAGLLNLSQDTTAGSAYSKGRGGGVTLGGRAAVGALVTSRSYVAPHLLQLRFSADLASTSTPISALTVPFSASDVVSWTYDKRHRVYRRFDGGRAQQDAATSTQISATNVVVVWARYTRLDPDIAGGGGFDVTLGGSGQVSVFRGGQRLDGKWKADGQSPVRFTAGDGSAIRLAPGNTWVEAIPLPTNITLR